jgi:hypothetical protein
MQRKTPSRNKSLPGAFRMTVRQLSLFVVRFHINNLHLPITNAQRTDGLIASPRIATVHGSDRFELGVIPDEHIGPRKRRKLAEMISELARQFDGLVGALHDLIGGEQHRGRELDRHGELLPVVIPELRIPLGLVIHVDIRDEEPLVRERPAQDAEIDIVRHDRLDALVLIAVAEDLLLIHPLFLLDSRRDEVGIGILEEAELNEGFLDLAHLELTKLLRGRALLALVVVTTVFKLGTDALRLRTGVLGLGVEGWGETLAFGHEDFRARILRCHRSSLISKTMGVVIHF